MPRRPQRPERLRGAIFRGRDAVEQRLLTLDALRSNAWRRIYRGVYADAALADTHRLRCVAAMSYLAPPGAAIAGRSAVVMYGCGLAEPADPVEIVVPSPRRFGPLQGIVAHTGELSPHDVQLVGRCAVTTPERTCWDLAQWLDVVETVVLIDRMLRANRVTAASLRDYASRRAGGRGARLFERAIGLADARAESPQESRLRVRLRLACMPPAVPQFIVDGADGFVARVDLAWPERKVALEYDGVWHVGSAQQLRADRRRLNRLVAAGWIVLHVTADRLRDHFPEILAELRAALASR